MNFSGATDNDNGEGGIPADAAREDDDDPLKWEKMYAAPMQQTVGGEPNPQSAATSAAASPAAGAASTIPSTKSEIRVVTFDLDNTVWKTGATISAANDMLAAHLKEKFGIEERSEKVMGQLFKRFPDRYAGVDFLEVDLVGVVENLEDGDDGADIVQNAGQSEVKIPTDAANVGGDGVHIQATFDKKDGGQAKKKPVYLTSLRKDAIRSLILDTEGAAAKDLEDQIDASFELWVEARCKSISTNFAPSAVPTLTNLRSQLMAPDVSQKIYIGAITDGNSDPDRVSELSGVFDFLIRAEDVGASKPDPRVYKAAVAALILQLGRDGSSVEEFFLGERLEGGKATMDTYLKPDSTSTTPSWKDVEEDAVEAFSEAVGPWWVHIGDDFFKDVVAAKEFQMRTVWTRELIGGSDLNDKSANSGDKAEKAQRSVTDLVNDISKSDGAIKMSIGESEFLSQSLHEEFSDAILDQFDDLSGLLMGWHQEGKGRQPANGGSPSVAVSHENNQIDAAVIPENELDKSRLASAAIESDGQPNTGDSSVKAVKKFCAFCGGRLPTVGKFCPNCGERQI